MFIGMFTESWQVRFRAPDLTETPCRLQNLPNSPPRTAIKERQTAPVPQMTIGRKLGRQVSIVKLFPAAKLLSKYWTFDTQRLASCFQDLQLREKWRGGGGEATEGEKTTSCENWPYWELADLTLFQSSKYPDIKYMKSGLQRKNEH